MHCEDVLCDINEMCFIPFLGMAKEIMLWNPGVSSHLSMTDDSDNLAVLLHGLEVFFNAFLAFFISPFFASFGESLLLGSAPLFANRYQKGHVNTRRDKRANPHECNVHSVED